MKMEKNRTQIEMEKKLEEVEQQINKYSMYIATACVRGLVIENEHIVVRSAEELILCQLVEKLRCLYELRDFLKKTIGLE